MKSEETESYKSILKAVSLLGSVRVITALISLIKNKIIAILLGADGIGIFGLFTNAINMVGAFGDLGISKSAVRNIALANTETNKNEVKKTIRIVRKLLISLSLASSILVILFSKQLSLWSFGNSTQTFAFILIGVSVFPMLLSQGYTAILQGLRKLKTLSKSNIIAAVIGLLISIPLIYFFKYAGIVYSILASAIVSFFTIRWYLRSENVFNSEKLIRAEFNHKRNNLLKLGISLTIVSFMVSLSGFVLRAYISNVDSINEVGVYQAGFQIVSGYFGMIFSAMAIDFFPRLSAASKDNVVLGKEVNRQVISSLLLLYPLIVSLLYFMPLIIELLYSSSFIEAADYVTFAVFGIVFFSPGQSLGMILLAKNNNKVYLGLILFMQLCFLGINILLYNSMGIKGLGIGYSVNMFINMILPYMVVFKLYDIRFSSLAYKLLIGLFLITMMSFICKDIDLLWLKWTTYILLLATSLTLSLYYLKKLTGVSLTSKLFRKIK